MKPSPALPLLSFVAALALASCGSTASQNDTDVLTNDAVATNDLAVEVATLPTGAEPVAVATVPIPAADAPAAEVAPLTEAATAAAAIDSGNGAITRIDQGDGWAWMQRGEVIRTASRDGSRVSYFHRGEDRPYLVQQGGRTYGYSGDSVSHVYGRDGRPQAPDANARRQAQQLDRQAQADRARARQAPQPQATTRIDQHTGSPERNGTGGRDTAGRDTAGRDAGGRDTGSRDTTNGRDRDTRGPSTRPGPTPTPTPSPTPTHRADPRENDHGGSRTTNRTPRTSATPVPYDGRANR